MGSCTGLILNVSSLWPYLAIPELCLMLGIYAGLDPELDLGAALTPWTGLVTQGLD